MKFITLCWFYLPISHEVIFYLVIHRLIYLRK